MTTLDEDLVVILEGDTSSRSPSCIDVLESRLFIKIIAIAFAEDAIIRFC